MPMTTRQRRSFEHALIHKLNALRKLGRYVGMYGNLRRPAQLTDEAKALCLRCVEIIRDENAHFIQKMACASLLDYFLPEWREIVGYRILGQVVDRNSSEVRAWRKRVLRRDGHRCVLCGSTENLEAHHLASWAEFPELRIVDENGMTLCNDCHADQHVENRHLILRRPNRTAKQT
ncbi:HNH endonuclease [Cohnella algarum]|nr:HNH endonuclease [Cohnella algarum]